MRHGTTTLFAALDVATGKEPAPRIWTVAQVDFLPDEAMMRLESGADTSSRTLMRRMGIEAIYRKPNTSRRHPKPPINPYLLRARRRG